MNPLLHLVGLNYHHPSAEDAWRRILTFFDEHLGAAGTGGGEGRTARSRANLKGSTNA